jgi:aspartate/tyrosine/aromatic aminotransferase
MSNPVKSCFSKVPAPVSDKIFSILEKFNKDENTKKMNLSIGMFFDDNNKVIEFESVKKAQQIIHDANMNKEYPPITGMVEFTSAVQKLFFPNDHPVVKEGRILTSHCITGGSSLRVAAEVITKFLPKKIHLSNLTFGPYLNLFANLEICYYPYYNSQTKSLDVEAFLEYLNKIEDGSIINLQLSGHNPTALDFTNEDWNRISDVMKMKNHIAFFDAAYLGYANGSLEKDLYPIHKFAHKMIEMFISYSSAKNFANFCDDIGALIVVLNKPEPIMKLKTHLVVINRSLFSFVSLYGSRIIEKILNTNELKEIWEKEVKGVFDRIIKLKSELISEIEAQKVNIDVKFLNSQKGIYLFFDMIDSQVELLADKYSIYLSS